MLLVLFWGGKSSNYGPEMLYFAWFLYPQVFDKSLRDAILKGGFIRCIIFSSSYKAINLFFEYINATYAIDIKNYKNSTYDIYTIFSKLTLFGSSNAIIRRIVEGMYNSR